MAVTTWASQQEAEAGITLAAEWTQRHGGQSLRTAERYGGDAILSA